jgi:hypothetical protein
MSASTNGAGRSTAQKRSHSSRLNTDDHPGAVDQEEHHQDPGHDVGRRRRGRAAQLGRLAEPLVEVLHQAGDALLEAEVAGPLVVCLDLRRGLRGLPPQGVDVVGDGGGEARPRAGEQEGQREDRDEQRQPARQDPIEGVHDGAHQRGHECTCDEPAEGPLGGQHEVGQHDRRGDGEDEQPGRQQGELEPVDRHGANIVLRRIHRT